MPLADQIVHGGNLSDAWLRTVEVLDAAPQRKLFHVVTRVEDVTTEDPAIRAAAERMSEEREGVYPIETVANTIFPVALADRSATPEVLAKRYEALYPRIVQLDAHNRYGTYFHRLVAYPGPDGVVDQLSSTIHKLQIERQTPGPKSARYEVGFEESGLAFAASVYTPGQDRNAMGFPCLSACSFQLERDRVHLLAHYRSQYLIERGYGNYLGLCRLLRYVAEQASAEPGQMTLVAGYAQVTPARRDVARLLAEARGDTPAS